MIAELIEWWQLDCLPAAQRLGYRREAAALSVRHRRLRTHWAGHLACTRETLTASARAACAGMHAPRRAWVMGAGLLQDVPLDALLELFERVDLVDVVFSRQARAAARAHPGRVACVMQDVTGLLSDLTRDPGQAAPSPPADAWCASVNILSQLPLLPCTALLRQGMSEAEVERRGRAMQQAHIVALERAAHACLIVEYAQTHPQPGPADETLLPELPAHLTNAGWHCERSWQWPLNPAGETDVPEGRAMQSWWR